MKKTTYYNSIEPDNELEIFINTKEEIAFSCNDGTMPPSIVSLTKEDVEELIEDLQYLLGKYYQVE